MMRLLYAISVLLIILHVGCGYVVTLSDWRLTNNTKGEWYNITVPATVFAGLLQNGLYSDIFYGHTLQNISTTPFNSSWWYSTSLSLPTTDKGNHVILTFKGLNYAANIWINDEQIGDTINTVGPFRYFEFDITQSFQFGAANTITVEIFPAHDRVFPPDNNDTDLAITFVDWSPYPPDNSMGLWREVEVSVIGSVSVAYPQVSTILTDLNLAHLTVMVEVSNFNSDPISGTILANILHIGEFSQSFTLQGYQTAKIFFTNTSYPSLNVNSPNLWWPRQMGSPNMYTLNISVTINGDISDELSTSFGIRETTSLIDENGHRLYKVNGKPILIRGAGWAPDLFLRTDPQRQDVEFQYVVDMGLNAIRLEGKMENDNFFDLADQYGILVMPGWCCCDAWQHWDAWGPAQYEIAKESLASQVKRLRIHPSILVFMYSSDELPPPNVEKVYLSVFLEENWPNPIIASAADTISNLTGPSGVKMSGPYSWVPPNYWLSDTSLLGGAFGFLTEGGPGEAPMPLESWLWTVPNASVWPLNSDWDFHCGNPDGVFRNLRFFEPPLYARYGQPKSAADFLQKSQVAIYESHRAMFEGYSRNKYTATGVIQWMLNNPWPEMIWHLYDYYLNPSGSYYGTKKACEDLHIQYSYNDRSIWIVNSLYSPFDTMVATIQVLHFNSTSLFSKTIQVPSISPDSAVEIFTIPELTELSSTYFVHLKLEMEENIMSDNFYWLSTSADVLDWNASNFYRTPCSSYSDFSLLQSLENVELQTSYTKVMVDEDIVLSINITNPTNILAFFVRLRVTKGESGTDVLPIFWQDNYFTLLPFSTKQIQARFSSSTIGDATPVIVTETYNNISGQQEAKYLNFLFSNTKL